MAFLDKRELMFDADAVTDVIQRSPSAALWLSLPPGRPSAIRFHPHLDQVEVVLGERLAARGFVVQSNALAAMLIGYCLRAKVPMPRQASKGVTLRSDSIVLRFHLRLELPMATTPEPEGGQHAGRARSFAWSTTG